MCKSVHVHIYIYISVHMYVYVYLSMCIYTYVYIYMCVCVPWAVKGLPHPEFGVYVYTRRLHGAFGLASCPALVGGHKGLNTSTLLSAGGLVMVFDVGLESEVPGRALGFTQRSKKGHRTDKHPTSANSEREQHKKVVSTLSA